MSGRVRSGAEKDLFKRLSALEDSDRYPTHPEMTLNDKLVQLELQFKECCKGFWEEVSFLGIII